MKALMTNGMRESRENIVVWPEVELDVFVAMYQFALTGKYETPKMDDAPYDVHLSKILDRRDEPERSVNGTEEASPERERCSTPVDNEKGKELSADQSTLFSSSGFDQEKPEDVVDIPLDDVFDDGWGGCGRPSGKKKTKKNASKYASAWSFDSKDETTPSESALWSQFRKLSTDFPVLKTTFGVHNFNPLFHAKVYCLAESQLMEPLKNCCLRHLHRDLLKTKATPSKTPRDDVVILDLAAFTYMNTARRSASGDDKLRGVVSGYIAAQGFALQLHKDFRSLLDRCGELGCDLFHLMLKL